MKPLQSESEDYVAGVGESSDVGSGLRPSQPTATASHDPVEVEVVDLYEKNSRGLFRFAETLVKDPEMAQDALQEVFLRYFIARSSGQEIRSGKAWLYRVLRNYLMDRVKEALFKSKANLEEAEAIPCSDDPEREYLRAFTRHQILEVLAPRELECLQLRAEGFDYKEIARILNVRSGTVGATLARALNKIRKALNPSGDYP